MSQDIEDIGKVSINNKCIGAMVCRQLAPTIFDETPPLFTGKNDGTTTFTRVAKQIQTADEYEQVRRAIYVCPMKAIGWVKKPKVKSKPLWEGFPLRIEDNVFISGYNAKENIAAISYLIVREKGNILIDPPSFDQEIVDKLNKLGGVKYLFITHKDHSALNEEWHQATNCTRIIHERDVVKRKTKFETYTADCELKLSGDDPFLIDDDPELVIIPSPGHTPGSSCLLYKDKFLFTGDHLRWSPAQNHLVCPKIQCWYSWDTQRKSAEKLLEYNFVWVLPGHGDMHRATSTDDMREKVKKCITYMKETPYKNTSLMTQFIPFILLSGKGWTTIARYFLSEKVQSSFPTPLPISQGYLLTIGTLLTTTLLVAYYCM
eukprot:TRINITY_DN3670_c0_g1_i2.p1 TRINITY_DN3670_c0_g1~~TRINITY_DN3670_c0_g1_i2.p1  ORF type:complete len:375 (-),score=50.90 TRINITY_DN3670_c0_g1_i2:61-1185(-)